MSIWNEAKIADIKALARKAKTNLTSFKVEAIGQLGSTQVRPILSYLEEAEKALDDLIGTK